MKLWLVLSTVLINGCSVYSASKAPDPIEYQHLSVGTPRTMVVDTLGNPSHSDVKSSGEKLVTTDNFKFTDGYHAGYKSRILLYLAGGFFSGGLSEIVFWPMEEYLLQGSENNAVVEYDADNKLKNISVFSNKHQVLVYQNP